MPDPEAEAARLADELAAEFGRAAAEAAPPAAGARVSAGRSSRTAWIVAGVSLAIVALQLPTVRASLAAKPSLHAGADVTDPDAEACIDTLWEIAALVRQGESAAALARLPFAEPVTHAHYAVAVEEGEIVVDCPNPAAHGLRRLRISERAPTPEALR